MAILLGLSVSAMSGIHENKKVSIISSQINEDCTIFQLDGVGQADSVRADDPWFAISTTSKAHDTAVSVLLLAKAAEKPLRVSTTGSLVCGHTGIYYVRFSE